MKTPTYLTFAAGAAACLVGFSANAGTPSFRTTKTVKEIVEEPCITGDIGFDIVSEYIRHGIVQENQGFIIQPYADLHFRIYKGAGPIDSITADIGIWNSFHDHHPGATGTTTNWAEFDFTTGLTFKIDKFSFGPQFKVYEAPNNTAPNVYTLGFNLEYDDSDLLHAFALHPHIYMEFSGVFDDRGSTGNGRSDDGDQYYELGFAPRHTWGDVTLTLPINFGFGSSDYYAGDWKFGYFSVGVDAGYRLSCVPQCLGLWTIHANATYYRLSDGATSRPGPNNDDNENQWVFGGGLRVAF